MLTLIFLLLTSPADEKILVLVNGKTMTCDQYERRDNQVRIQKGEQVFMLPESSIDWERTENQNEQQRIESQKQKQQQASKPRPKPAKREIVLTNDQLPEAAPATEPSTTSYRVIGNSIIVQITINGSGPYEVVLDTGASLTVLDPQVLDSLMVPYEKETVTIMGVGGRAQAGIVTLNEIAVSDAKVSDLPVAAHRLDALKIQNVIGLLGQDFLNHFVMNLNASNKTLTLTPVQPNQERHLMNQSPEDITAMMKETERLKAELGRSLNELGKLSADIRRDGGQQGQSQRIRQIIANLNEFKRHANDVLGLMASVPHDIMTQDQQAETARILRCQPQFERFMRDLMSYAQLLRRIGSQTREGATAETKHELDLKYREIEAQHRETWRCAN